ncbi:unnamed protein product [Adineta steineri]|uniref:Uncharacterized protein n=1 Tax=Adineta steineri TaxID=433720 RepID=A0A819PG32_9BILA|nr:unnamed protein product [Adineta steineri]CAF4009078.1 unnamed protein product [Adineta steineri]
MYYRAGITKKPEKPKIPTTWQIFSILYDTIELFLELILSFPIYILTKLGITNIIPTLLAANVVLGPVFVAATVTTVACSTVIGLGVGLGVGLTCSHNNTLMNNTNTTDIINITNITNMTYLIYRVTTL